ncbi:MAG: hypothetical protein HYV18_01330 [Gammaproteobacteria bacterium]|nr:hypothetical protein [Gammaproteobacteria bacterium]
MGGRRGPAIVEARGLDARTVIAALEAVPTNIQVAEPQCYAAFEAEAKGRLERRDIDDWDVLALALATESPIWTEDRDFFGTGVATWKIAAVARYFSGPGA